MSDIKQELRGPLVVRLFNNDGDLEIVWGCSYAEIRSEPTIGSAALGIDGIVVARWEVERVRWFQIATGVFWDNVEICQRSDEQRRGGR